MSRPAVKRRAGVLLALSLLLGAVLAALTPGAADAADFAWSVPSAS